MILPSEPATCSTPTYTANLMLRISPVFVSFRVFRGCFVLGRLAAVSRPDGDGHATAKNLPTTWNETTNVAWKAEIPGKGWSSPSLVQNRLYLTTAAPIDPVGSEEGELSLRTLCLDAATGKTLWNTEIFRQEAAAPKIHTKNSHASPTPLVSKAGASTFISAIRARPASIWTGKISGRTRRIAMSRCMATAARRCWSMAC